MSLQERLLQQESTLSEQWRERLFGTYASDTARHLAGNPDRFANPVGRTIVPALDLLLHGVLTDAAPESFAAPLDDIVRIRAVQEFEPSKALAFVFDLKELLTDLCGDADRAEVRSLEARIDALALQAFDRYVACREQLHEIRTRELHDRTCRLDPGRKRTKGGSG